MPPADITLAILAGGAGSRMGTPKANLRVNDQPILVWLLDQLRWPGPTMLVTAPGVTDPPGWERFDRQVVDPVAGLGPLRGVLTSLERPASPRVCVTTVDMPRVNPEMLSFLAQQIGGGDATKTNTDGRAESLGVMCERLNGRRSQIEPFPSIFHVAAREVIRQRLDTGQRSVNALRTLPGFITVPAPPSWPPEVWTNLNTPEDLIESNIALA